MNYLWTLVVVMLTTTARTFPAPPLAECQNELRQTVTHVRRFVPGFLIRQDSVLRALQPQLLFLQNVQSVLLVKYEGKTNSMPDRHLVENSIQHCHDLNRQIQERVSLLVRFYYSALALGLTILAYALVFLFSLRKAPTSLGEAHEGSTVVRSESPSNDRGNS